MAAELVHLRHSAQPPVTDATPVPTPAKASPVPLDTLKLLLANDSNDAGDSLTTTQESVAMPASLNARAHFVLQALFAKYASPTSPHHIAAGNYVKDIYLLPIDIPALATPDENTHAAAVAVVNLDRSLAEAAPQGEATEMLTLRSMVGTLHSNLPQIVAVRFLVDGQPAETLAGHASLEHIYSATEEKEIALAKELP
jgi:hypothetical protein